ncbi:MAG: aminotransferase class V-fold PLP-dependent enzyme [Clostridia bacterium]|nr:aminotransferase class V-fold PLP-dependent enzyme [Clostridia bacterium]
MIYLDNSATSYPKPKEVYEAYKNAIKYYHSNPGRGGYENSIATSEKIYETRLKAAAFFGEEKEENVIFTPSCTFAVNMVMKGVLNPGDHVLISDLEHNAVVRVLEHLRRYNSIKYDTFSVDFYDDIKTLQSLKNAFTAQTKLVFCTHASNVLGVCLPIRKIGMLCKQNGVILAVDGAQSAGIIPIHMKNDHIDYLCLAPHKGLFAPMGTGMLIGDALRLKTVIEGGTGSQSRSFLQPDYLPDKHESGTQNTGGIIAMSAGIDWIQKTGIEKIYRADTAHIKALWQALKDEAHIQTYVNIEKLHQFAPVFSFNIKNMPSEMIAQMLAKQGICVRAGLHCAPLAHQKIGTLDRGTVRISSSFFTTNNDINYTISNIKNLLLNF